MKKTLITHIPAELPQELQHLITGADIYDSSSSPEARVYFIDKDGGYYLKCAKTGTLEKEAKMTQYFHSKNLGAEVLNYSSKDHDWLLTKAVVGHDCIDSEYLSHPKRLCDTIATELRKLHEIDYSDCPVMNRTTEYLAKAENNYRTGNYDKSSFPDSFDYRSEGRSFARPAIRR